MYVCMYVCTYIYIYRERERYMYIFMYLCPQGPAPRARAEDRPPGPVGAALRHGLDTLFILLS